MKPVPRISPTTAPYWEAAAEGKFLLPWCLSCSQFHHHPRSWCPHCWSTALEWREPSGCGHVITYTVVHQPPSPDFETPYILAVVRLEEGPQMMTNIVDARPETIHVDLEVTVTFERRGEISLPQFRPLR